MKRNLERHGVYADDTIYYKISKNLAETFFEHGISVCKEQEIPTTLWSEFTETIQNVPDKEIATIVKTITTSHLLIKVGKMKVIKDEYEVNQSLKHNNLEGFVCYHCYASCKKDQEDTTGFIIMPYYEKTLEIMLMEKELQSNVLGNIVAQVITNYFKAFEQLGFVHRAFVSENIVIDDDSNPLIMNVSTAILDNKHFQYMYFWKDVGRLFYDITRYLDYDKSLDFICRDIVLYRAFGQEPTWSLLEKLCQTIKRMLGP